MPRVRELTQNELILRELRALVKSKEFETAVLGLDENGLSFTAEVFLFENMPLAAIGISIGLVPNARGH